MTLHVQPGADLPPWHVRISAAHVIGGAVASRDWQPQHHDRDRAQAMNLPDIILNTPSQLGWFCRFATAWSGPEGRVGRTALKMRRQICPGDEIGFAGRIEQVAPDVSGWRWVLLDLTMKRGDEMASGCRMWIAVPGEAGLMPWQATADLWAPPELA